jgi:putative flippase GtrA
VNSLIHQLAKFATVGVVATFIHVASALLLNSVFNLSALQANFGAFIIASVFSYLGNWVWTFKGLSKVATSLPRFIILNLLCFALNQSIVYYVVEVSHLPLWLAMIPVGAVIPAVSFWMSRAKIFVAA